MGSLCFHTPGDLGHGFGREATTDLSMLGSWVTRWDRLKYLTNERMWFLSLIDNGYEIAVAGDER